jgi:hypothetical protein
MLLNVMQYWPFMTPLLLGLPLPIPQPVSPFERSPFMTRLLPDTPPVAFEPPVPFEPPVALEPAEPPVELDPPEPPVAWPPLPPEEPPVAEVPPVLTTLPPVPELVPPVPTEFPLPPVPTEPTVTHIPTSSAHCRGALHVFSDVQEQRSVPGVQLLVLPGPSCLQEVTASPPMAIVNSKIRQKVEGILMG